jgi:thiol:disulfide interchange protein DsbC
VFATDNSSIIKEKLSAKLQNTQIDKVTKSNDIDGLYEIDSGKNVFYTDANAERLILGHVFTLEGKDLTQQKLDEKQAQAIKEVIDLKKAIKIGNGKHEVIEFTDPECPFCRRAEAMMQDANVTKYIFFTPLPFHKVAKPLAIDILCAKDQASEYEKVMRSEKDKVELLTCKDGEEKLKEMMEIGNKFGVTGTPLLIIDGKEVRGASPEIVQLVK